MNILCAVAHQMELDPFKAKYSDVEQFNTGHGNLYRLNGHAGNLNLIRTGIGLETTRKSLEHALQFLSKDVNGYPDVILNFGTCGAIHPERGVGDVVIGTEVLMEDQPSIPLNSQWINRFREYLTLREKESVEGIIYTTEKAVADERTRDRIYRETQAQIVEMECYSVALVAEEHDIPLLAVKCISDNADEFLMKDFLANVNETMTELSDIIAGFIDSIVEN